MLPPVEASAPFPSWNIFIRLARAILLWSLFGSFGCHTSRVQVTKEAVGRRQQWAGLCLESAMLSAVVYGRDEPTVKTTEDNAKLQKYKRALAAKGWQRRGRCDRTEGEGRGLYFEVWQNDTRKPRRIIFVFRGTTGGPDWGANLRWLRIHKPRDHYVAALEECIPLIEEFYKETGSEKPIISTTGHSLGAGLAQEILYAASDKVDHCIAFDPSPVTGLHELPPLVKKLYRGQLNRSEFSQYRIIRAYEKGEILMFARNIVSLVHKPDSQTISIEFDAPGRLTAVGKHSITLLADHIDELSKISEKAVTPGPFVRGDLRPPNAYQPDPGFVPRKDPSSVPMTRD